MGLCAEEVQQHHERRDSATSLPRLGPGIVLVPDSPQKPVILRISSLYHIKCLFMPVRALLLLLSILAVNARLLWSVAEFTYRSAAAASSGVFT